MYFYNSTNDGFTNCGNVSRLQRHHGDQLAFSLDDATATCNQIIVLYISSMASRGIANKSQELTQKWRRNKTGYIPHVVLLLCDDLTWQYDNKLCILHFFDQLVILADLLEQDFHSR